MRWALMRMVPGRRRYSFFLKHKTAYELRMSDWSSDVCSSDLKEEERRVEVGKASKAALGDALDHGLAGIGLEEAGVEVGADIAGRQRIDADPEAREFERGDLGQQIGRAHV